MSPQIIFAWLILTLDPSDGGTIDRAFRFESMEACLTSVAAMRVEQAQSHDNEGVTVAVCVPGHAQGPRCLAQYVGSFPYCFNADLDKGTKP